LKECDGVEVSGKNGFREKKATPKHARRKQKRGKEGGTGPSKGRGDQISGTLKEPSAPKTGRKGKST